MAAANGTGGTGGTRSKLLCVDDEALVLSTLNRLFRADYDVTTASSGEEALGLIRKQHFDVVISDQRMPGMKGVDLLRQIKELAPQTMRILLTGYADLPAIIDSVNEGEVFRYITKPWKNEALKYTVALAAQASRTSATDALRAAGHGLVIEVQRQQPPARLDPPSAGALRQSDEAHSADDALQVDVLLIDDDQRFVDIVRHACGPGRTVHFAATADDALRLLEKHEGIGVIISEVRIGQSDVTQLLSLLKRYHPNIVTVVASGYSDANVVIKLVNEGQIFRFLSKPAQQERVRDVVRRAGKLHRSMREYSSLAARHVVDEGSIDAAGLAPQLAPATAAAASPTATASAALLASRSVPAALISRIAGLFRRR